MSIWISTKDQMPPINEEVLILYKDKKDELKEAFSKRLLQFWV